MQHLPRWLVSIVFILGLWLIVQPVSLPTQAAGPWYVATTGSDTNSCLSTALPCATLNGVLTKAQAGDDIYVAGGTYVDTGDAVAVIAKGVQISGGWNPAFTAQITTTILDAQNQRRGVSVSAGSQASLDHITIQNG